VRNIVQRMRRAAKKILASNDRMVNFVVCGTQKGGTSALDAYLRDHLEICMSDTKEVHFFDNEANFLDKEPIYSKYHSSFSPRKSHKLIGEATPIYMYWHDAPRRIREYNPDMKLIVLLRNPIERAYSHWNMERSRNADDLSFWNAIQNEQERCRGALPFQHRVYSYIDRGFYLAQLRRLWSCFPRERILILKSEYLRNQPSEALRVVCDFLEVDRIGNVKPKTVNSIPYESKMSNKEITYLRSVFEHEIRCMESVLGWDLSDWLTECGDPY
jgi:hypothetical protein